MDSNITINIVEPGSVIPVPDTGLSTTGIDGAAASTLVTIAVVVIIAIATILHLRKKKISLKPSKRTSAILGLLAIITSIGTFTGLTLNSIYNNTNAEEGTLTVNAEDADLTIELGDEPVFAVLPVDVKVAEPTPAGYTITSYTDSTDLVSTTDESKTIPMIAVDKDELATLTDNTYGLSLTKPEDKDSKVYTTLSTDQDNPTLLAEKEEATEENDTTTVYYGFYITPDVPYGTYKSSDIYYNATTNSSKVIFHGNGLYFNNNPEQTTNDVEYTTGITEKTAKYSHTPNIGDDGTKSSGVPFGTLLNDVVTIPNAASIKVQLVYGGGSYFGGYTMGYFSFWEGSHPEYRANINSGLGVQSCGDVSSVDGKYYSNYVGSGQVEMITTECNITGDTVTFDFWSQNGGPGDAIDSWYGYYAVITGYDADGNAVYLPGNIEVGGEYKDPSQDLPYIFLGWNEDKDATTATYESKNDIELSLPLVKGKTTELYAIWQHATKIHFDGNGSTSGEIPDKLLAPGKGTGLCGSYSRDGYIFNNWNTKPDGSGESYGQCYWYTASADQSVELNLYAQWSPATTIVYDGNGYDWGGMGKQTIYPGNTEELWNNDYHKNGYYFTGWNTQPDGSGEPYDNLQPITASDQPTVITLYAQWTPEGEGHYTIITFDANGGEGEMQDQIVAAGQTTQLCTNYWKDSYWFFGWNTEPDGTGTRYDNCGRYTAPAREITNITLYAIWAEDGANTTIIYEANGGEGWMDSQTIWAGNTEQIWGSNYWWNGYNFIGWNTEPDGTGTPYEAYEWYTASNVTETITLYAQWEEIPHTTITFNGNGADSGEMSDQTIYAWQGDSIWCGSDYYRKDGYYFVNWNTDPEGNGMSYDCWQWYVASDQSETITLYAQWGVATTFIYDGNGADGGGMQNQNIPAGQGNSIWCANGNYFKDGYYSFGWNTDPEGNGTPYNCWQWYEASDQSEIITLYAQWSPATTIIFDGNGADWGGMSNETIPAGNTWELWNNDYHKNGYYFTGWNTESDGTGTSYNNLQYITASDQSTIITLYAQWTPEGEGYYTTITFDGNGADGGEMQDQIVAAGQTAQLCANYWKDGYWFFGWNTDPDGNGTRYDNCARYTAPANETNNITLYAIWAEEGANTTIVYNANGGEGYMDDQTIWAGNTEQLQGDGYSRNGYYFTNWNTAADGTGTSYNAYEYYTASNKFETITLYAQWGDCTTSYICYKSNGADGSTSMQNQYADFSTEVTLWASNFSYSGHGFAGWSKDQNAAAKLTDDNPDNNPTIYGPNQTIFTENMDNGMSLYAVWLEPAKDINNNPLTFQTENLLTTTLSDNTTLASKPNGYVTALKDSRDNQVYTVAKLADGNYWMIENLRLDSGAGLNSKNTNNPVSGFALSSSSDEWGDDYYQSYLNTNNTTNPEQYGNPWSNTYSYGNYYNWYSATAGWTGNSSNYGDICPAGWQLPYGGSGTDAAGGNTKGGFYYFNNILNNGDTGSTASNNWRSFPNNFVFSGRWNGSSPDGFGYVGYYWSSTGRYHYGWEIGNFYFGNDNVYPDKVNYPESSTGYSVRCLAQIVTSITFDGNGADGGEGIPSTTVKAGRSIWLGNGSYYYTKTGYKFAGWNTEPDGSGTAYAASSEFIGPDEPGTITLYAQWEIPTTIVFNGNGNDGGQEMNDWHLTSGQTTQLCGGYTTSYYAYEYYYRKNNHIFIGWNTEPDGSGTSYADCAEFTAPAEPVTITLYAQWQPYSKISFNSNGGEGDRSDEFIKPGGSREFCNYGYFTKTNYYFYGWNTEPDGSGTSYSECEQFIAPTPSVDITLYAQWTSVAPNKISYNSNGANGLTTMADQQLDSYQEVTLWASNFSYSGHGFAGWSEDQDAAAKLLDNDSNNDPVIYGPNQNVNIDPNTGGMSLYAVWLEPAKDINNNPLTFQTENLLTTTLSDNTTLASKSNGYVTALKDERDNQVYAVAKLADGNYWMIENLRLDNSTTNEFTTSELSSANTNNPSLPLINVYGSTTSNRLSASSNSWCYNNNANCINQSKINTDNITNTVSTMNSTDANIYSYGNYYNWYSATAGNGTYNTTSGNVVGDLCPAGWQLPIGNETSENGSFSHLDVAIGGSGSWSNSSAQLRSFPNNFVYSGYYGESIYGASYRGTYGRYWSSTARNSSGVYQLLFYYNNYYPGTDTFNKRYGGSIRCVAPINSATSATSSAFSDNTGLQVSSAG